MSRPSRRRLGLLTPAIALMASLALLAGCGSDDDGGSRTAPEAEVTATPETTDSPSAPASAPASSPTPADEVVVDITIKGGTLSPDGTTVAAKRNQPVVLRIDADKAGELHVHSSPEQHVDFAAGRSTVTLSFDKPGIVEIEDHAADTLIVQVEVR